MEPSRRNHRPGEKEVSAGEGGVLYCLGQKMQVSVFAHGGIRLTWMAGLSVVFLFAKMRLLLVSNSDSDDQDVRQIQTCAANRQPAEVVLDSGLLDF